MPFYKRDGEQLMSSPTFVLGPNYSLEAEHQASYTYPIDGWYWFDTLDAAMASAVLKSDPNAVFVSRRQGMLAMLQKGVLDTVEYVVSQSSREIQISYLEATEFRRMDPMLISVCKQVLRWNDQQIDDLFILAKSIPN